MSDQLFASIQIRREWVLLVLLTAGCGQNPPAPIDGNTNGNNTNARSNGLPSEGDSDASPTAIPVPAEIMDPPWLAQRQKSQIAAAADFGVFHDFSFSDQRVHSGIDFRNKIVDDAGRNYKPVHYDHGNGIAVADIDGDTLLDIYFVTQASSNQLWRNLGGGEFENITQQAGVALADRIGVTASFADIDNDGDPDLYVTSVRGGNALFENTGGGNFRDVSIKSGLNHIGHSSAAVFFDYDRDGLLDVFLTNVGKYTRDATATVTIEGQRDEPDGDYEFYDGFSDAFAGHLKPAERNEPSLLFRNLGNLRFENVTEAVGLHDVSWTGDATSVDFNRDGWLDLYVLNMQGDDQFYINLIGKQFVKSSRESFPQTPWGSMGVKAFDYDNDGDLDLFVTDMHSDMSEEVSPEREKLKSRMRWPQSMLATDGTSIFGNAFYQNQGDGTFKEISAQIGAENYWPWGISVDDLNADGFDDVFITASMNFPFRYGVNSLLLNDRGARFLDSEFVLGVEPRASGVAVPWFEVNTAAIDKDAPILKVIKAHRLPESEQLPTRAVIWSALGSRSSAIFDLENDGDLDIVTNEFNHYPMVLVSNLSDRNDKLRFLKVKLHGTQSNRSGLGAVVTLHVGERQWMKVNDGQSGYMSHSDLPLYFGLDGADQVDRINIVWPSGANHSIDGPLRVNRLITVREDEATPP